MIKCRYVATIVIDIAIPEDIPDLPPFEEINSCAFDNVTEKLEGCSVNMSAPMEMCL